MALIEIVQIRPAGVTIAVGETLLEFFLIDGRIARVARMAAHAEDLRLPRQLYAKACKKAAHVLHRQAHAAKAQARRKKQRQLTFFGRAAGKGRG